MVRIGSCVYWLVVMIVSNSVKCHKCGDEIWSAHVHDYKSCSCSNISIDGGNAYLRRGGAGLMDGSYTDLSIDLPTDVVNACIEAWDRHHKVLFVLGELHCAGYKIPHKKEIEWAAKDAVRWGEENDRNSRGIVYAIFRALRDKGVNFEMEDV